MILISFDTLRRDHVHAYGHRKRLSPVLDRLARQGVLFKDAVVNCGWTLPQHVTLLTGLYPISHGLIFLRRRCRLAARFRTLAEVFEENGYVTLGFGNRNAFGGGCPARCVALPKCRRSSLPTRFTRPYIATSISQPAPTDTSSSAQFPSRHAPIGCRGIRESGSPGWQRSPSCEMESGGSSMT